MVEGLLGFLRISDEGESKGLLSPCGGFGQG